MTQNERELSRRDFLKISTLAAALGATILGIKLFKETEVYKPEILLKPGGYGRLPRCGIYNNTKIAAMVYRDRFNYYASEVFPELDISTLHPGSFDYILLEDSKFDPPTNGFDQLKITETPNGQRIHLALGPYLKIMQKYSFSPQSILYASKETSYEILLGLYAYGLNHGTYTSEDLTQINQRYFGNELLSLGVTLAEFKPETGKLA